jgi:hypothetical protein
MESLIWYDSNSLEELIQWKKLIGSDLVYPEKEQNALSLFITAKELLSYRASSSSSEGQTTATLQRALVLAYVPRVESTTQFLFNTTKELGFKCTKIPWNSYTTSEPKLGTMILILTL